jgi:glyoxylase-like metal-dependent hydrolase (beta-lactamase superfamily II)
VETRALTPQLTMLRFTVGQAYVWRDGEELTLIDTGPAGSAPDIVEAMAALGRLRRIVLTHFHDDHTGSAAALATEGVQVLAHRADAPVIRGFRPGPPPAFRPVRGRQPPAHRLDQLRDLARRFHPGTRRTSGA